MVVREETAAVHQQVGVGDLDDCAGSLAFAFEEAALRMASLKAIHAWHAPQAGRCPRGDWAAGCARRGIGCAGPDGI
jgi:hypothetical protein